MSLQKIGMTAKLLDSLLPMMSLHIKDVEKLSVQSPRKRNVYCGGLCLAQEVVHLPTSTSLKEVKLQTKLCRKRLYSKVSGTVFKRSLELTTNVVGNALSNGQRTVPTGNYQR